MSKKQFEYLEAAFAPSDGLTNALNDYGQSGWQLVSIERGNFKLHAIFMREIRPIPTNTAKQNIGKKPGNTTTRF